MARELGDYKINVNCIAPGATVSEDPSDKMAYEQRVKKLTHSMIPKLCLKRIQVPGDRVGTINFLASSLKI
jgi:3-oxoacyl-[acyl-carrier protein] reductase